MAAEFFDDPRLTAVGLLIEVHGGLTAKLDEALAQRGLSGNDFDTLVRLARAPDRALRMSDLAARSGLSTSGMTRIVDRLEREGLVCRNACTWDRRSSLAALTEPGCQRLAAVLPEVLDVVDRHFTGVLTSEQLDALLTGLRAVRAAVLPHAEAG
jgi:MarR family transcriptional regulator, 2-MHQ and catechol-resistance regulon repressor